MKVEHSYFKAKNNIKNGWFVCNSLLMNKIFTLYCVNSVYDCLVAQVSEPWISLFMWRNCLVFSVAYCLVFHCTPVPYNELLG